MVLEKLYTEYYKKLLTTAYLQTYDFDIAEELVQKTFLTALIYPYDPDKGTNPYTWLTSILRWEIIAYINEKKEQAIPLDEMLDRQEVGDVLGLGEHLHMERMVDAALCIKRLPPVLRMLAEKYFLEGYTIEELMEETQSSRRTIERMITRIYDRFRGVKR